MAAEPLDFQEFTILLKKSCPALMTEKNIAVGLSGGPDSLILTKLANEWAQYHAKHLHALTIDHGLRAESAQEAEKISKTLQNCPSLTHRILKWDGEKPATRIQEAARNARYRLMSEYCSTHNIRYLLLAHHQDDQMETFLFRLAKGSGLDGLSLMKPETTHKNGLIIVRPFLDVPKDRLIASCAAQNLPYLTDPGNNAEIFLRGRLRKFIPFLEQEGFTAKRMMVTARRLNRARSALEQLTDNLSLECLIEQTEKSILYKQDILSQHPEELALRIIMKGFRIIRPPSEYAPRLEKMENLFADLMKAQKFRKRTLGGVIFERDDKKNTLRLSRETKQKL